MQIINGERHSTVTPTAIKGFFGPYRFLSNFHLVQVEVEGLDYPSSEHAYMAMKTQDQGLRAKIAAQRSPLEAKKLGRALKLRDDWDLLRLPYVLLVLTHKFKDPELRDKLLDTGSKYLEETNDWGDRYWGVDSGQGSNYLGQLLMLVRSNLQLESNGPQKDLF